MHLGKDTRTRQSDESSTETLEGEWPGCQLPTEELCRPQQKLGGPPKGEVFLSSMGGSLVWGGGNKMEEILKEKFWLLLSHKYDVMGYSLTVVRTDSSYGGLHLSYWPHFVCWSTQPVWRANCSIKRRGLSHPCSSQTQLNAFYYRHLKLFTIMLSEMVWRWKLRGNGRTLLRGNCVGECTAKLHAFLRQESNSILLKQSLSDYDTSAFGHH